jgi:hypothetical protein
MTMTETTSVQRLRNEELSTPQALAAELTRLQATKVDYVVDTRRMSFASDELSSYLSFDTDAHHDGTAGGPVLDYAHNQIAQRLGVPRKYYDRMREDAPALLDQNVNHWFHTAPEQRMVRTLEGHVRAFLSNRYRRLDNYDLMEQAVLPEFARFGDSLVFHAAALTDSRLYIRAILPELSADVEIVPGNHTFLGGNGGGDIVQAGVQIRNSEVGAGKLDISPFIWRLRCINGLVMADRGISKYHVGRAEDEETFAIYADDTRAADDRAYFLKARDAIRAALDEVQFKAIVDQLRELATGEPITNPVKTTELLAKTNNLMDHEQESILGYLTAGGDLTQWGVVNAVTSAAKDAEGFDRQAELETLGGELVAMGGQEWAKIAR